MRSRGTVRIVGLLIGGEGWQGDRAHYRHIKAILAKLNTLLISSEMMGPTGRNSALVRMDRHADKKC